MNGIPGSRGGNEQKTSSGSRSGNTQQLTYEVPSDSALTYLESSITALNGINEIPLTNQNADKIADIPTDDLTEEWKEIISDLSEDYEYISVEDFFGADFEEKGVKFAGTPKLIQVWERPENLEDGEEMPNDEKPTWEEVVSDNNLEDVADSYPDSEKYPYGDKSNGVKKYIVHPDMIQAKVNDEIKKNIISDINKVLVTEGWDFLNADSSEGEYRRFKAMKGRKANHDSEKERLANVAFTIDDNSKVALRRANALKSLNRLDDETAKKLKSGDMTPEEVFEEADLSFEEEEDDSDAEDDSDEDDSEEEEIEVTE